MYCISDPNAANQALSNLDQLEFFGLPFYYNSEYTLIPRFDTEVLVRHVLKCVPEVDRVIDIGTGS
jgi:methylase of polypeptide subunit release factors